MGRQQSRVDSEVGGAARVGLHVHAPLAVLQAEGLQGALLAEVLNLVDDLVATVVASARLSFGVLVRQGRAKAFHHGSGGEVLGSNELNGAELTVLFLLHQVVDRRVHLLQALVARELGSSCSGACSDALGGDHELGVSIAGGAEGCLRVRNLAQALEDAHDYLLEIQGVEMQAWGSAIQASFAELHALLDTPSLEGIVAGVGGLGPLQETRWKTCLAELRHALQAT
mmetsp:Transcript_40541/g.61229  ORF Transcript_40541/g.61229 Transcript_40541/m.61229 type:complete len:227 (+) Transcript_40541:1413-2093(+)